MTLTVALGCVRPDLGAAMDLEAAERLVWGMPNWLRIALATRITELTREPVAAAPANGFPDSVEEETAAVSISVE